MKLLRQGTDEECCGLYSIAMATGKPLGEVVNVAAHYGRMSINQIRKTVSKLGFDSNMYDAQEAHLVAKGILILYTHDLKHGHAVAYEDGVVYDCDSDTVFYGIHELLSVYNRDIDDDGRQWYASKAIPVFPAKVREWAINQGNQNEEVAL